MCAAGLDRELCLKLNYRLFGSERLEPRMEHSNENRAILVVDDESSVLFTYRMILEQ